MLRHGTQVARKVPDMDLTRAEPWWPATPTEAKVGQSGRRRRGSSGCSHTAWLSPWEKSPSPLYLGLVSLFSSSPRLQHPFKQLTVHPYFNSTRSRRQQESPSHNLRPSFHQATTMTSVLQSTHQWEADTLNLFASRDKHEKSFANMIESCRWLVWLC